MAVHTGSEAHKASCTMGSGSLAGDKAAGHKADHPCQGVAFAFTISMISINLAFVLSLSMMTIE